MGLASTLCVLVLAFASTARAGDAPVSSCLGASPTPMILLSAARCGSGVLARGIAGLTNSSYNLGIEPFGLVASKQESIYKENPNLVPFIESFLCPAQKKEKGGVFGFSWKNFTSMDTEQIASFLRWVAKNKIKVVHLTRNELDRVISTVKLRNATAQQIPRTCKNATCAEQARAVKINLKAYGLWSKLRILRAQRVGVQNTLDKYGVTSHQVSYSQLLHSNVSTKLASWHGLLNFLGSPRKSLFLATLARVMKTLPTTPLHQKDSVNNYKQVAKALKESEFNDLLH